MARFPTASEVEAGTPAGRDRVLDLVRIVSLLVVVTAHAAMAVVWIHEGGSGKIELDNLLGLEPWLQPITWIL